MINLEWNDNSNFWDLKMINKCEINTATNNNYYITDDTQYDKIEYNKRNKELNSDKQFNLKFVEEYLVNFPWSNNVPYLLNKIKRLDPDVYYQLLVSDNKEVRNTVRNHLNDR